MRSTFVLCFVSLFSTLCCGQTETKAATSRDTTAERYIVLDADRTVFITEADTVLQMLYGNVKAEQSGTFMYADSAKFQDNTLTAMSEVVLLQGDTVSIFADSLFYDGDTSMAYLYDRVVLENNDQQLFTDRLVYNADLQIAYYYDTAVLVQQTSTVKSLKGVFDIDNEISYFYHYVTVTDGDMLLRSDSLVYYNGQKKTEFNSPTRITTADAQIYCEDGFYDVDDSLGVFRINAQYVNETTTALADTIYYDGIQGSIRLLGNARYYNGGDTALADMITYEESSGEVVLLGSADYRGQQRDATGDEIRYNEITEAFAVKGRSTLRDEEKLIDADQVVYDKVSGKGQALGDVVYRDTVAKSSIIADSLDFRDADEYVLAVAKKGKPVYSQLMSGDSIHISADTLRSYMATAELSIYEPLDTIMTLDTIWVYSDTIRLDSFELDSVSVITYDTIPYQDTSRYIVADRDVEIYRSDLQAVADSLIYDRQDSVITLFGSPVMWSDTTQFSGDTIRIYMVGGEIDRIEIIDNAMILSSTDLIYYSQIAGRRVDAFFVDGSIDSMIVSGNAQSIYYMQDDEGGYIGINKTVCGRIVFLFEEEDLSDIKFYNDNESQVLPIKTTDHEALKLDGFKWQEDRRPLSSVDIRA